MISTKKNKKKQILDCFRFLLIFTKKTKDLIFLIIFCLFYFFLWFFAIFGFP